MLTVETYNFISRQVQIYFGLFIFIFGIIGGILNMIIFATLKTFRETPCGFYLVAGSIVNIVQLLTALLIRILTEGFNTNLTKISWVCKGQIYILIWCLLFLLTIMCLAAIDQYISMSKYHRFSNQRFARRAVVVNGIFWGLYSISMAIYWDAPSGVCKVINPSFQVYMSRFHAILLTGFLPLFIMTVFSLLAFHSARTLVSRQRNIIRLSRDRQLTAMTLCEVAFTVMTKLPFAIFYVYVSNQISKSSEETARNSLIYSTTILISYASFPGSFYVYCCASNRFRKQFIYVLTKMCIRQNQITIDNQVAPYSEGMDQVQHKK